MLRHSAVLAVLLASLAAAPAWAGDIHRVVGVRRADSARPARDATPPAPSARGDHGHARPAARNRSSMNKALRYHHARRWGVCDELPAWWNDPFATDGEAAEVPAAQEVVVEDAGPPIVLENPDYESVGDRATAEYEARQTAALERLKARLQTTRRD